MKIVAVGVGLALASCGVRKEPQPRTQAGSGSGSANETESAAHDGSSAPSATYDQIAPAELNRLAVRLDLPLLWSDANSDKTVQPDELSSLLFYPPNGPWVENGKLTHQFEEAYAAIVAGSKAPPSTDPRRKLVDEDLDAGKPTLIHSDLRSLSADDKKFTAAMLQLAASIDTLYDTQTGAAALADQLPNETDSRSLFRRNRGPRCVGPQTALAPECSAIPGAPSPIVSIYPTELQRNDDNFCKTIEGRPDAAKLLEPFTVVSAPTPAGAAPAQLALLAVPYSTAYADQMTKISDQLVAAADAVKDPAEQPLVTYLRAAAASFKSNDWTPADEAWAKMTVDNSKWYVRAAPDETYWDPCNHKAGFHLTFARIDAGSKHWQSVLTPLQQEMETAVAAHAGAPYVARKVTFHLPDFIDIIVNAGDDRQGLGGTAGESLPNFGPVANGGRGRTVAMVNLDSDPSEAATRRAQAESVLDADSMKLYSDSREPGLLTTILHEATHNLGPAHQYKVAGKDAEQIFGGPVAAMLEELKAETGALFLVEMLRAKKLITDDVAHQTYVAALNWAFHHTADGMYGDHHSPKTYGQLAAIQLGFLIEHGVLEWKPEATAANGKDKGAFVLHIDKMPAAADEMLKLVAGIKARGDKAAALALIAKYVDAKTVVPHDLLADRYLRFPRASYVYAVDL